MTRRRTEESAGETVIPVTPMLDVTFQMLVFFIITFSPNRIIEGVWPVDMAAQEGKVKEVGRGAEPEPFPTVKEPIWILKVRFEENNSRSSEDNPRPIDSGEIDKIKNDSERNAARELARRDRACFVLTLNHITADGSSGGNDITVRYDDLVKELATRVEIRRKEVVAAHAGTENKEVREAEIAADMTRFKVVIQGDKKLRWWRFNQIRDVCYAAGFRNIQPGTPDGPP